MQHLCEEGGSSAGPFFLMLEKEEPEKEMTYRKMLTQPVNL